MEVSMFANHDNLFSSHAKVKILFEIANAVLQLMNEWFL